MWSLGFTAAWAESCEMGTSWNPLELGVNESPEPLEWLLSHPCVHHTAGSTCISFPGTSLGLTWCRKAKQFGKYTETTKSKPRVEILWEAKLFSAQPSNQAYRVVSGPYSHPLWGSQLLPTSSWPSPGASQGWGSAAQWAGRQPRTTCPLLQCPHTRPSFPTPADLYHMGSHILGFLRLCQIWF